MLVLKRTLLAACSVALMVSAAPALADSMDASENPKELQVSRAATAASSYAAPTSRAGRAQAVRSKAGNPAALPRGPAFSLGASSSNAIVAEARRYLGTNPTNRRSLWCGAFMNMVLERTGYSRGPSDLAKSFASYGTRVSGPQVGALAIMSRGPSGGHVGVVSGIDPSGNVIVVSGNHNNTVAESVYPRGRIIAYVMPDASGSAAGEIKIKQASINTANGSTQEN